MDKGAVAVIKKRKVVKHLMNGKGGELAKSVFFFRRADTAYSKKLKFLENQ